MKISISKLTNLFTFVYNMYQMVVATDQLINILNENQSNGHQISRRYGVLNMTKCIFINDSLIYLFNISEDFIYPS